jgi:hypothetical protein
MGMTRASFWFGAGSCVLVLLGLVHSMAVFQTPVAANDTERQLLALMNDYRRDMMGSMRSTADILRGFNIALSVFSIGIGALNFALGRLLAGNPRVLLVAAGINVVWLAAMLANSVANWFAAPTAFLLLSLMCYAVAAIRLRRGQ